MVMANASAPATVHGERAPGIATLGRFALKPSPHSVQNRSPTSDGAEHAGHGGPRNAPPQRAQKFAPSGFSGY